MISIPRKNKKATLAYNHAPGFILSFIAAVLVRLRTRKISGFDPDASLGRSPTSTLTV